MKLDDESSAAAAAAASAAVISHYFSLYGNIHSWLRLHCTSISVNRDLFLQNDKQKNISVIVTSKQKQLKDTPHLESIESIELSARTNTCVTSLQGARTYFRTAVLFFPPSFSQTKAALNGQPT